MVSRDQEVKVAEGRWVGVVAGEAREEGAGEVAKGKIRWGLLGYCGDLGFNSQHEEKPSGNGKPFLA